MIISLVSYFTLIKQWLSRAVTPVFSLGSKANAGSASFEELDDAALIEIARAKGLSDDRAFRELWRRHQKMVWRTCYSFVRNAEDAQDLVQDVFFKAYRSLKGFEGRASFKTWVNRIAINTAQNEIRRRSRRPQESENDLDEMAEYLPVSSGQSVESRVSALGVSSLLQDALLELRPDEFEVIIMKDIEDRPYAEIATEMGIGLSAAKMRVQRARLALQRAYVALGGEES